MKKINLSLFALAMLIITLSSCSAITGIFSAGFKLGIIIAVIVAVLLVVLVFKAIGGKK